MGTDIFIFIIADSEKNNLRTETDLANIENIYRRWEKIFSRFDPESELSKINRRLGNSVSVSPEMLSISKKALGYYLQTEKLFDPRIIENLERSGYQKDFPKNDFEDLDISEPPKIEGDLAEDIIVKEKEVIFNQRMDFSGIVKGWATDEVALILKNQGWKNFLIDSGGDIFIQGKNKNGEDWSIGAEGISEDKIVIQASGRGIATSGITRRKWESKGAKFHHLINPLEPGKYSFDLKSVSVVAASTEKADVAAKVLFLMGINEGLKYAQEKNIAVLFLDSRGSVRYSRAMKEYLKFKN